MFFLFSGEGTTDLGSYRHAEGVNIGEDYSYGLDRIL